MANFFAQFLIDKIAAKSTETKLEVIDLLYQILNQFVVPYELLS